MIFNIYSLSPKIKQYACVQIANLSIICMGMSNVWPSPMVVKLRDQNQTILPVAITENQAALITSIGMVVGVSSLFYGGVLIDKLGRKNTIILAYVPRFLTCGFDIFTSQYWMILVGRSFGGIADLLLLMSVSTYSSEIASKEIRGASGTLTQINSALGMLIILAVGPYVSYQTMNILMATIVVVCFIPLMIIPESPFFLYSKGQTSKSLEVLTFLYGTNEEAKVELKGYSTGAAEENKWALLKEKTTLKSLIIVILMSIGLPLTGYHAINLYLQTIFESADTTVSSAISSLIIGLVQFGACFVALFITNRFGRKPIILSSNLAILIGVIGLGTFFTMMENYREITGLLNFLPLISAGIVIFSFNAGIGSLFWMVIAELLYSPIRPYGISMAVFLISTTSFIVTLLIPTLNSALGASGVYWLFSVGNAMLFLFVLFLVPETKGKTFIEIQTAFGRTHKESEMIGI